MIEDSLDGLSCLVCVSKSLGQISHNLIDSFALCFLDLKLFGLFKKHWHNLSVIESLVQVIKDALNNSLGFFFVSKEVGQLLQDLLLLGLCRSSGFLLCFSGLRLLFGCFFRRRDLRQIEGLRSFFNCWGSLNLCLLLELRRCLDVVAGAFISLLLRLNCACLLLLCLHVVERILCRFIWVDIIILLCLNACSSLLRFVLLDRIDDGHASILSGL